MILEVDSPELTGVFIDMLVTFALRFASVLINLFLSRGVLSFVLVFQVILADLERNQYFQI